MSAQIVRVTLLTAVVRNVLLVPLTRRPDRVYRLAGTLLLLAGIAEICLFVVRYDGLGLLGLTRHLRGRGCGFRPGSP